ncbi:unnamed protein product [Rotaria sordida]|uniref:GST N-terminal domain-containing protein n=1 Tax=Rotaria sordida TaxID=392033 RepID=A0A819X539_9BILA|nr:unnamed protein product [Rotaria sordida]CAF4136678.1 unnamed protein product [Rotaria sordida]
MPNVNESNNKQKNLFIASATLQSSFRNWIKNDPSAEFPAESNRYHLYVALACPWAHRTLVVLKLKGLEHIISYSLVDGLLDMETDCGWAFNEHYPDPYHPNFTHLKNVYQLNDPNYTGIVTVPVLFDIKIEK